MMASILHTIGGNYEDSMLRHILGSSILVHVTDMVNGTTDCIQESRASTHLVIVASHRLHFINIYAVVKNLAVVVEKHSGYINFTFLLSLLLDSRIEATDGVSFKAGHRAASVKDKYKFCDVVFHKKIPPFVFVP
jgi:hypothetical protein